MRRVLPLFVLTGALLAGVGCDEKKPNTSAGVNQPPPPPPPGPPGGKGGAPVAPKGLE